jgi:energy-coupling factor transport system ATP-binding protein
MSNSQHKIDGSNDTAALVEVKDLVHVYPNGTKALDTVSMLVKPHERLAIVGQNGSGKTTLVKHFNALLRPTLGTVSVMGFELTPKSKVKTSQLATMVGYVFQNPNHQLFSVNVYEELCFGLRNLKLPPEKVKARADEAVEMFRLQPYLTAHPYSLSMGARKLVAIASVFAMGPQLMILDEPTTGQDHEGKNVLSQALTKIFESGKTLVFVSHDMRFVSEHAERAIVMTDAKIIFEGGLRELFVNKDVLKYAQLRPLGVTVLGQRLMDWGVRPDVLSVPEMVTEVRRCLA